MPRPRRRQHGRGRLSAAPPPRDADAAAAAAPSDVYARLRDRHAARAAACGRRDVVLANLRLGLFVAAAALGGLCRARGWPFAWLWLPGLGFVAVAAWHARVLAQLAEAQARAAFYATGLRRLAGLAEGPAVPAGHAPDPSHPFAADLDLFGAGGLFARLCTAQTGLGQQTLASWLSAPGEATAVRARQAQVQAMVDRLPLREDLWVLGGRLRAEVHPAALAVWGSAPAVGLGWFWLPWACHALLLGSVGLARLGAVPPAAVLVALAVQLLVGRWLRPRVDDIAGALQQPGRELPLLAAAVARLDAELAGTFACLQPLRAAWQVDGEVAWRPMARLARLVTLLDAPKNQLVAPFAWTVLLAPHVALACERWRQRHGAQVARWCAALGEAEALVALGGYAYEHPADPFPEVVDGPPQLAAQGLAHPALPPGQAVPNDIRIDAAAPLWVVSGSNMSGKSTWLRSLGCNVVLALAGAPVRATALTTSAWSLGATLRVQDSLRSGTSRFYAEVQRLQQLVALAEGPRPLLFLLDELFSGTNSHDRAIGAAAVLETLRRRGAMGLVTTHDLALTAQTEGLGGRNVHFVDHLEGATLRWDYRMRDGVVRHSNALALLQQVGLYAPPPGGGGGAAP